MPQTPFHPVVDRWFTETLGTPTNAQTRGWNAIRAGQHTLIAAPTGSGKTLAAFLSAIDDLFVEGLTAPLPDQVRVVYVSPLKALSTDIHKNLAEPRLAILKAAEEAGLGAPRITAAVRTGDTTSSERAAMLKTPPHILVTTPESLYLLLTAERSREMLRNVRTVIVDEIHAVIGTRRGAHLALTLERLQQICEQPLHRIGLSATQKPIEEVARYLVGVRASAAEPNAEVRIQNSEFRSGGRDAQEPEHDAFVSSPLLNSEFWSLNSAIAPCAIIDEGHKREMDLAIETPRSALDAVMSAEVWEDYYDRLTALIEEHKTTLVFVNTRKMAERVARHLSDRLGEEAVTAHHGSLSKENRHDAETRLKNGQLRALVATASLELGIDIGHVDLVCQIGSPHRIATFLQRVGRSGHTVLGLPKGRLFPESLDDLFECAAMLRAVRRGELDRIVIHDAPLDVLAQQLVAETACDDYAEDALYAMTRRAWPYRELTRESFDAVVQMVADGYATKRGRRGALLHRDEVNGNVRGRRGSRMLALTSGGAIPEIADYRVVLEPDELFIGTLNEDFAIESMAGDVFQLGNTSWRITQVTAGTVRVADAQGAPPTIPFWLGEAPARSDELSQAVSALRADLDAILAGHSGAAFTDAAAYADAIHDDDAVHPTVILSPARPGALVGKASATVLVSNRPCGGDDTRRVIRSPHAAHAHDGVTSEGSPRQDEDGAHSTQHCAPALEYLIAETGIAASAAQELIDYLAESRRILGVLPTQQTLILERFFDESGGMQLILHAPFGSRINKAWGLALRKRFCRQFNFELQAAATENALLLSLGPSHSFPLADVFRYLHPATARDVLVQAFLDAPVFQTRWRWNTTISLAVPRFRGGRKVPPQLQRTMADDLMAACFPDAAACFENIGGDRQIPDHPLVNQVVRDCLEEAMDFDGLARVLSSIHANELQLVARDTPEPSPLAHEILNAKPYAFLDDAPLEERRTHAVQTRRAGELSTSNDLGALDLAAIERVRDEERPDPRDADELHDALITAGFLTAGEADAIPAELFSSLAAARRAGSVTPGDANGPLLHARGALADSSSAHDRRLYVAAERLPELLAIHPELLTAITAPPSRTTRSWTREEALVELLRGRLSILGPTTAQVLAAELAVSERDVDQALITLESEGAALRGTFTPGLRQAATEWCDRRLLARIHRYTLNRLRAEIEPVTAAIFTRFLLAWQHVTPSTKLTGIDGLRAAITQLDGFEVAANAWERAVLPARVDHYEPSMLDMLCLTGEVGWGRLSPSSTIAVGATPIALFLREHADIWQSLRELPEIVLGDSARQLLETLQARGASFARDLGRDEDVQRALAELVSAGLVASDGFAGLRAIVSAQETRPKANFAGRWSTIPRTADENRDAAIETQARVYLRRYGVVFRRLLTREPNAAPWRELARVYRRLEARGEIRGGRFVNGMAGEQFALPEAIERLREIRRTAPTGETVVLSAADPLNLIGILTTDERIRAVANTRIAYRDGIAVSVLEGEVLRPLTALPELDAVNVASLLAGRRVAVGSGWVGRV